MNVFPTSYFPSIHYLQKLQEGTNSGISGNEIYQKQTFRNRCALLTGNGIQFLSVPVVKPFGSKSMTNDLVISDSTNWRMDHWRAIESSYRSAPYFEYFDLKIKELIFEKQESLFEFNFRIINYFNNLWELKPIQNLSANQIFIANFDFLDRQESGKPYIQVFSDRFEFQPNLSILDLLFCEGPMGRNWFTIPKNS